VVEFLQHPAPQNSMVMVPSKISTRRKVTGDIAETQLEAHLGLPDSAECSSVVLCHCFLFNRSSSCALQSRG